MEHGGGRRRIVRRLRKPARPPMWDEREGPDRLRGLLLSILRSPVAQLWKRRPCSRHVAKLPPVRYCRRSGVALCSRAPTSVQYWMSARGIRRAWCRAQTRSTQPHLPLSQALTRIARRRFWPTWVHRPETFPTSRSCGPGRLAFGEPVRSRHRHGHRLRCAGDVALQVARAAQLTCWPYSPSWWKH